jgi:hypothetical protein
MRIPLVRFGNDNRPIEEWEDRWQPVMFPLFVVFGVLLLAWTIGFGLIIWLCSLLVAFGCLLLWPVGVLLPRAVRTELHAGISRTMESLFGRAEQGEAERSVVIRYRGLNNRD